MTEQIVSTLKSHIKELETQIESKNKEIDNLRALIYKLQDIKESK
jgi:chaperonin cofactor prefoldin